MAGPEAFSSSYAHGLIPVADADTSSLSVVCHTLTKLGDDAQGVPAAQAAKHALHGQSYDILPHDSSDG